MVSPGRSLVMVAEMEAPLKPTALTTEAETGRKRRRKRRIHHLSEAGNPNILFSLTLAGIIRHSNPSSEPLIKQCSRKFVEFLHSESSEPFLNPILSLLPLLLRSNSDEVACSAARIAGAMALVSIEANERVASESEVLRVLVVKIVKSEKKVVKKAMCDAVLDVSTTSFGRRRLIELSSLNYLMLGFDQLQKSLASSFSVNITEREGNPHLGVESSQDELPLLLLDSVVTLTNSCNMEQLKRIPKALVETFFILLREMWSKVRDQLLTFRPMNFSGARYCYISNFSVHNLAETSFRLSMDASTTVCPLKSDTIIRRIFGSQQSTFKDFLSERWESTPLLMTELSSNSDVHHDILGSCIDLPTCGKTMPTFLSSTLRRMVSCPPIALNEIDTLTFLSDVRGTLGCPVTYQQDIRVVRTNLESKSEEHYFQESLCTGTEAMRSFSIDDVLKCEVAYKEGYTIAFRGMQFRFKSIAAISQEIASLFGQPSVGANLYITPPNSQGLACHFDDHCVFVCQLRGTKEWSILPQPVVHLPRLYEHLEVPKDLMKSRKILLREGDVLYIPRGFAHEAHTVAGVDTSSSHDGLSVHLTLAIEVEPPFLWEGFAHVALHQWGRAKSFGSDCPWSLQAISVSILHVSIHLISDDVLMFRKACLVAASPLPQDTEGWLDKNQRTLFNELINKIDELANFEDSLEFLRLALERNENPFHWLRWLEHLNCGTGCALDSWNSSLDGNCRILTFIRRHKEDAKAAFAHVKSKFCSEVMFDSAKEWFKALFAMYRQARMQYLNGMLSLHC